MAENKSAFAYARVVQEDLRRKGMLYLGMENGLYVTVDDGAAWMPLQNNLPHTPIAWLTVQEDYDDLVVATWRRGFWIMDDIVPLQQPSSTHPRTRATTRHMARRSFVPRPFRDAVEMELSWAPASNVGNSPPDGTPISYYLRAPAPGPVRLTMS
jgi:hypothetical protein